MRDTGQGAQGSAAHDSAGLDLLGLVLAAPEPAFVLDPLSRRALCWNESFIRLSRLEDDGAEDLDPLAACLAPVDVDAVLRLALSAWTEPAPEFDAPLVRGDGSTLLARWRLAPLPHAPPLVLVTYRGPAPRSAARGDTLARRALLVRERVRQLRCLYGLTDLLDAPDASLEEILQGAVDTLPEYWPSPERTTIRVRLGDQEHRTTGDRAGAAPWILAAPILVNGEPEGRIEVRRARSGQPGEESPFGDEDRALIEGLARRLGRIIERQRLQRALRFTRFSIDSARDAILWVDLDSTLLLDVNEGACRLFGYSREELLEKRLTDLDPWTPVELVRGMAERILEHGTDRNEVVALTKGGKRVPLEVDSTLAEFDGREFVCSIARDITDRKLAEREVRKFRAIAEHAPYGVAILDGAGRYQYVNQAWGDLLECDPEELLGRRWSEGQPEDVRADGEALLEAVRGHGAPTAREVLLGRRGGSRRPVLATACLVPSEDEGEGFIAATLTDITDLKEAQRHLAYTNDELTRSNRELQQFAYVASHDLKEPLRYIASTAHLLRLRHGDSLPDGAKDLLQDINAGVHRMAHLIDDLLAYSRVGRAELRLGPVDVASSVRRAMENLASAIEDAGARIVTEESLPVVHADEEQMVLLLQNLIANAVKFRGEHAPEVRISAERADEGWVVTVRDNGIGIESWNLERIFEMFQRLHATEEYAGSGMGLAICRRIAERQGGRIWAESVVGEGAAFHVLIGDAPQESAP